MKETLPQFKIVLTLDLVPNLTLLKLVGAVAVIHMENNFRLC